MTSSTTSLTNLNAGSRTLGLPDIALCGKAGAGKSSAADLLCEIGYRKLSFAAPLKDVAVQLWGTEARTDREKLQKLGVAVREIEPSTWVDLLLAGRYTAVLTGRYAAAPTVVDDLRFPNEYWALKAEGFVIVSVHASKPDRINRLKANGKWQHEDQLEHESETALDEELPDYSIGNTGTVGDLYDDLINVVLKERKRR